MRDMPMIKSNDSMTAISQVVNVRSKDHIMAQTSVCLWFQSYAQALTQFTACSS
jgi:hypothetical protein